MIRMICRAALCAAVAAPGAAHCEEPLATDRPDVVESADVVGRGRFQIETSVAQARDKTGGVRIKAWATPTLLRAGITDTMELRVETEGRLRVSDSSGTGSTSGNADTEIGLKWHFQDGDEAKGQASMALLFHAALATGSGEFKGQGTRPSVRLVAEWELDGGYSLGVMPGLFQERNEEGKRYVSPLIAVVVGRSLTDEWRAFAELAAEQLTSAKNGGKVVSFNVGSAYLLSNNWQVDVAVSRGLTRQTPDWAWTVGLSARF